MPAKFGCPTHSSEMRRLEHFTTSSLPTSTLESSLTVMFSTASEYLSPASAPCILLSFLWMNKHVTWTLLAVSLLKCLQSFNYCLNAFKMNTKIKICLRWVGKERCWVYMERWEPCSTSEQPLSTRRIQTWSIWKRELWCCNINWWVLIF